MFKFLLVFILPISIFAKNYWVDVGKKYGIEPQLLYAIGKVESGVKVYLISVNFSKLNGEQSSKLNSYLNRNKHKVDYKKFTQVISLEHKNARDAKETLNFLLQNKFPSFDTGVMQINNVHKELLEKIGLSMGDLFNPEVNINFGAFVLSNCIKKHGKNETAINAYNGKIIGNPYSGKVLAELRKLYYNN